MYQTVNQISNCGNDIICAIISPCRLQKKINKRLSIFTHLFESKNCTASASYPALAGSITAVCVGVGLQTVKCALRINCYKIKCLLFSCSLWQRHGRYFPSPQPSTLHLPFPSTGPLHPSGHQAIETSMYHCITISTTKNFMNQKRNMLYALARICVFLSVDKRKFTMEWNVLHKACCCSIYYVRK